MTEYIQKRKEFSAQWHKEWKAGLTETLIKDAAEKGFGIDELLSDMCVDGDFGGYGPMLDWRIQKEVATYLLKHPDARMRIKSLESLYWDFTCYGEGSFNEKGQRELAPVTPEDAAIIPLIRPLLYDSSIEVQKAAIQTLGMIRDRESLGYIESRLSAPDVKLRQEAFQAFECIEQDQPKRVIAAAVRLLADPDIKIMTRAIYTLRDYRAEETIPDMIKMLSHPSGEVRMAALRFFVHQKITEKTVLSVIALLLQDPDSGVRQEALGFLGLHSGALNTADIRNILISPDDNIKRRAFFTVRESKNIELIPDLIRLLYDQSDSIRENAVFSLTHLKAAELEAHLPELFSDPATRVRIAAVYAAGKLRWAQLLPEAIKLIDNPDDYFREVASVVCLMLLTDTPFPRWVYQNGSELHTSDYPSSDIQGEIYMFESTEEYAKSLKKLMTEIPGYENLKCKIIAGLTKEPVDDAEAALKKWQEWKKAKLNK